MRESTLITKSSIRRASPQLRLRTGLAWGIAVAVDAWLVWLKWRCLPNTIREIIRMFPEAAFLHDPAMLWQFVAASCLQVVVIASLYLAVARIPARWVPWLRIATLAAFAAICISGACRAFATMAAPVFSSPSSSVTTFSAAMPACT